MHKRITLATVVALLVGLLVTALPGTALQSGDQPSVSQGQGGSILQKNDPALVQSFLQALAERLGIGVEELEQAIQAAKEEVIEERLGQAVRAGRMTPERARALGQRLSQAGPRDLWNLMIRHREARERMAKPGQRMAPFGEELKRGRLIGPQRRLLPQPSYVPPYYQPYPYNFVCYCSFPGWYFMPMPMQPQPMMPQPPWGYLQPEPQPQGPEPQAPQGP